MFIEIIRNRTLVVDLNMLDNMVIWQINAAQSFHIIQSPHSRIDQQV